MVVFHKTYELVKWMHGLLNNFPKSEKYTLAQRIENTELSVLEGIIQSNNDFDKRAAIERTIVELDKLRIFFRLAKDLQFIPFAQYEEGAKRLDEIGRLLGGWRKKSLPVRQAGCAGKPAPAIPSGADAKVPPSGAQEAPATGSATSPARAEQGIGNIHCPSRSAEALLHLRMQLRAKLPRKFAAPLSLRKQGFRRSETWAGQDPEHARAVIRGGNWDNGANAGPFNANLNNLPTDTNNNIGFRCCNSSEKAGREQIPSHAGFGAPTGMPDSARELQGSMPKHAISCVEWGNGGMLNMKVGAARLVAGSLHALAAAAWAQASKSNAAAVQACWPAAFGQWIGRTDAVRLPQKAAMVAEQWTVAE